MNEREALKLALEALENLPALNWIPEKDMQVQKAITAIREALALSESSTKCEETSHAQPEQLTDHIGDANKMVEQPAQQQKPYGYVSLEDGNKFQFDKPEIGIWKPVYTTPPHRKPLTDEEIKKLAAPWFMTHYWNLCNKFARSIEAAHGIKE